MPHKIQNGRVPPGTTWRCLRANPATVVPKGQLGPAHPGPLFCVVSDILQMKRGHLGNSRCAGVFIFQKM